MAQKNNKDQEFSGKRKSMFKTLRRLHGQNLDHSGLNDLTEAFATFMTRARFFSIGHIRRTWSHSAVEFMKYRRRLPQLMDRSQYEESDSPKEPGFDEDQPETSTTGLNRRAVGGGSFKEPKTYAEKLPAPDPRKIYISNVSYRVTMTQLASFFSKFGTITACSIPHERSAGTFPRSKKSRGIAYITFKTADQADKAKNAQQDDLRFYDRVMTVVQALPQMKKRAHSFHNSSNQEDSPKRSPGPKSAPVETIDSLAEEMTSQSETEPESPSPTFAAVHRRKCEINKLPDGIFVKIFSYLDLLDRVKVERVCKRWEEMAFQAWNGQKELDFRNPQFSIFCGRRPLQNSSLKAILHRCGRYLKSLDLSGTTHFLDEHSLQIVAYHCPNLVDIDLTGLRVRWQALKQFAEACPNMQSVAYRDVVHLGEKAFWYLFRNCNNLQRVDLSGCRRLAGRCFRLLGLFLEEVNLNGCMRLEPRAVEEICLKSPNVRILRLDQCYKLTDESLNMIARSLSDSLEVFTLCGDAFSGITADGLVNLSRIDRITQLDLDGNQAVNDQVIASIVEGCPSLERVSLVSSGKDDALTEQGLSSLSQCFQLKCVDLSYLVGVKDSVLKALSGLECLRKVKLRGCTCLTDRGLICMGKCRNLNDLDLSGCILLGNDGIQSLVRAFPLVCGGDVVQGECGTVAVVIGGTSANWRRIVTHGSRVVLDVADYSSAHLCPGVRDMILIGDDIDDLAEGSDGEVSDDEFESLTAQRSFVLETLEEDDMVTPEDPFLGWEEPQEV